MDKQTVTDNIRASVELKQNLLDNPSILNTTASIAEAITACYNKGGKVLFCGNGGSAADAQHLAAELSGRYYYDRPPLYAEALHVNTSYLTAVANDYSYDEVFSRLIVAIGQAGDILVGLSTSGNSANVLNAMDAARMRGMTTVAFTGQGGGKIGPPADYWVEIPSSDTPRIQECHMLLGHAICQIVEQTLFPRKYGA